jgi:hypothetical protein
MSDAALEAQTEALLERLLTEMIKMASEEDGLTYEVRRATYVRAFTSRGWAV